MMDTDQLASYLGLHRRALLRRVETLGSLVSPYMTQGKNGGFLFHDGAVAVLHRLVDLERDGLSVKAATDKLAIEMEKPGSNGVTATVTRVPSSVTLETSPLIDEMRTRISEKDREIEWLRRMMEQLQNEKDKLLLALPTPQDNKPLSSQMSRWQALRIAFLGR